MEAPFDPTAPDLAPPEVPSAFGAHDEAPPDDVLPHDLAELRSFGDVASPARRNSARSCASSFGDIGSTDEPPPVPAPAPPEAAAHYASSAASTQPVSELASETSTARVRSAELDEAHLRELFEAFSVVSSTGDYEMDSSCFCKFCKDARLLGADVGRSLTRNDADLIFTRSKARGNYQKRIGWKAFRALAVRQLAARKHVGERQLAAWLRAHATEGPQYARTTTRADAEGPARFHDARETWTGVAGHCGGLTPSKNDHAITLATLCDRRSPADARGVPLAAARDRGLYYTSAASGVGAPIRASSATRFDWAATHRPPPPPTAARSPPSATPPPPPAAPTGPTLPGQANRPGGVYDRLSHPDTFTGIHGVHWRG